jgi:hypothetical protein
MRNHADARFDVHRTVARGKGLRLDRESQLAVPGSRAIIEKVAK